MLITFGFIALLIGVILIALGYTVEPRALRPGWAALILAIVLIALGYLLPTVHHDTDLEASVAGISIG